MGKWEADTLFANFIGSYKSNSTRKRQRFEIAKMPIAV